MKKDQCVEIGYISKAHGLNGEVKAVFDVHDLAEYLSIKELYLSKKDNPLRSESIEYFHPLTESVGLLKLKGINYRDQAEELKGTTLFFPIEDLPQLEDGRFYYFQIIGFEVRDKNLGTLGTIKEAIDTGSQDILIMEYLNQEVMIPVVEEFVLEADMDNQLLHTNLPDGLLELYTG